MWVRLPPQAPLMNLFELFEHLYKELEKSFFYVTICQGNLHKIKKEHLIFIKLYPQKWTDRKKHLSVLIMI